MTTKQMKRLKPTPNTLKDWAREMARDPLGHIELGDACRTWLRRKGLA